MPGDYSEELVEPTEQVYLDAARAKLAAHRHPFANDEATIQQVSTHPDHRADVDFVFAAGQRAILDALSSAGRLVPEGSKVQEEFGVRHHFQTGALGDTQMGSEEDAIDVLIARVASGFRSDLIRRRVITTPWTPAEPAQEER